MKLISILLLVAFVSGCNKPEPVASPVTQPLLTDQQNKMKKSEFESFIKPDEAKAK